MNVLIKKEMTKEEVARNFRRKFFGAIRHDMDLVVDLATMVPDIKKDYDTPNILPLKDLILNRNECRNEFITKKLAGKKTKFLEEHEDVDKYENKGAFWM